MKIFAFMEEDALLTKISNAASLELPASNNSSFVQSFTFTQ
jgi:hypothetical protein